MFSKISEKVILNLHNFLTTIKRLTLVHLTIYKKIYQDKFWVQGIFKIF